MDWMEDRDRHSQRLHYYIAAGLGFQPAVEEELKRYRNYYTVSAVPAKPLHIKEMLMPDWKPLLENAFAWLGDWRPSAILGFLLTCHEVDAVQLPPHHVDFVKELIRISHHNETILDEEMAEYQAILAFNPAVATPRNAHQPLPALFFALHDSSNTSNNKNDVQMKSHVKDDLVTCMRRDLTRMNRIVMQAHDMRFNAVEVVANRLLTSATDMDAGCTFLVSFGQVPNHVSCLCCVQDGYIRYLTGSFLLNVDFINRNIST